MHDKENLLVFLFINKAVHCKGAIYDISLNGSVDVCYHMGS